MLSRFPLWGSWFSSTVWDGIPLASSQRTGTGRKTFSAKPCMCGMLRCIGPSFCCLRSTSVFKTESSCTAGCIVHFCSWPCFTATCEFQARKTFTSPVPHIALHSVRGSVTQQASQLVKPWIVGCSNIIQKQLGCNASSHGLKDTGRGVLLAKVASMQDNSQDFRKAYALGKANNDAQHLVLDRLRKRAAYVERPRDTGEPSRSFNSMHKV